MLSSLPADLSKLTHSLEMLYSSLNELDFEKEKSLEVLLILVK